MSKTVTIPSNVNWLEICLNGKRYKYKGGASVSVPNEIADLLSNNQKNEPGGIRPVTGELKNAGLIGESESAAAAAVFTDPQGKMYVRAADLRNALNKDIPEIVKFTRHVEDGQAIISADKTPAQIAAALGAGRTIQGSYNDQALSIIYRSYIGTTLQACVFQGICALEISGSDGAFHLVVRTITLDDEAWVMTEKYYDLAEESEDTGPM